jgi:hypothetical protein
MVRVMHGNQAEKEKEMKLELKNIKYFEAGSEETHCYRATLYVDGKRFAVVSNAGHGGPDNLDPWSPQQRGGDFRKRVNEIEEWLKENGKQSKYEYDGEKSRYDLEMTCGDLLTDHLLGSDLKRALKKKVLFVKDGKVFEVRLQGQSMATATKLVAKHHGTGAVVLNTLPFDEALCIYREPEMVVA